MDTGALSQLSLAGKRPWQQCCTLDPALTHELLQRGQRHQPGPTGPTYRQIFGCDAC